MQGASPLTQEPILTLRLRPAEGPLDYDLNLLATTAQGLANRRAPRVIVENPLSEARPHDTGTAWQWIDRFTQPGEWLAGRRVEPLETVAHLVARLGREVKGVVIFDPAVPATSNTAVTLAAREGLAVTGPDGHAWLTGLDLDLPVMHDLRGRFTTKSEAIRWMIETLIEGRTDLRMMSYVLDAWRRSHGGSEDGMDVEGMDYVIALGGVAFDLTPWGDEAPVDDPAQPPGDGLRLWHRLFRAAALAREGEPPLEVTGFPFWRYKYSNYGEAGGRRLPHEAEWEAIWQMSPYGVFLNPLIAPNMSFHRYGPLPRGLTQRVPPEPPPLANKTYICLHLGDFDGGYGVYRRLPVLWSDPRRGEMPLGWGVNPNLARNYPDIVAWTFARTTPNDHLWADASSAGYVNPNRLLEPPPDLPMRDTPIALWRRFCRHWYERLDYTISPMVLDQHLPRPEVLDAFADFSPGGAAWLIENRRGETVAPLKPHLWRGMPVARLHDLSYAKSDAELADWMLKYAENDSPDRPAFHLYRFEWKPPSLIFDTVREVQRRAAPREWLALHPRQWFELLKRHLAQ